MQIDVVEIYKIGGAIVGIILFIIGAYKLYDKICDRLTALEKRVDDVEQKHKEDINRMQKENAIIIRALRGVLDGQMQQGCNGECKKAKEELDDFLNNAAHAEKG